jgi:hypothetical protein
MPDYVDPKAVDALSHPEAKHVAHCFHHFRISPVQIRLGFQKGVVIVLAGSRVEFPGAAAKLGQLLGGPPAGAGSHQMYQSRLELARELRLSMNQGCWSDEWFGTKSRITLIPCAWEFATKRSKSAMLPKTGSISM